MIKVVDQRDVYRAVGAHPLEVTDAGSFRLTGPIYAGVPFAQRRAIADAAHGLSLVGGRTDKGSGEVMDWEVRLEDDSAACNGKHV